MYYILFADRLLFSINSIRNFLHKPTRTTLFLFANPVLCTDNITVLLITAIRTVDGAITPGQEIYPLLPVRAHLLVAHIKGIVLSLIFHAYRFPLAAGEKCFAFHYWLAVW